RKLRANPHAILILTAGDSLDEAAWRSLDLHHRSLAHAGATLLVLSQRAAEFLGRVAVHLASWLSGSISRASVREEVESLVNAGHVGEARARARHVAPAALGAVARVLEPPVMTTRPASGRGDF